MKKELNKNKSEIVIYQAIDGSLELNLDTGHETIWASQAQIATIFEIDRTRVTRHINNIIKDKEIDEKSNVRKTHIANSDRPTKLYSLDMILAVGYRTNSKQAIKFRRWASEVLKGYLINGIVINQKRLDQLNKFVEVITRSDIAEVAGVGEMMKEYVHALHLLEAYDESKLKTPKGSKESWRLTYEEARSFLDTLREQEGFNDIFTKERDEHFKGIVAGLYQTFGGKELYSTVEEKAVNLLYQVVKDHPFFDGNKRGAAALFIFFLSKNKLAKNINSNTLAATTLLTALSEPQEHEQILLLIRNFLATDGKWV